jgi:Fur family ferric uptake transcriptional regulator
MKEILKKKGHKATTARLAILDIFDKSSLPLDAEGVVRKLSRVKIFRGINEATIYRTLSSFEKSGILKRVDFRKDSVYFELEGEHHHHIVCTNCSTIEDFEIRKFESALRHVVLNSSKFKSMHDHSLELFGLCRECA